MGDGEFVGNQSIHWRMRHANDLDDIRLDDNHLPNNRRGVSLAKRRVHGRDTDRELNDVFEVTLRFDNPDQADAALKTAPREVLGHGTYVTITVPAPRRANPNTPRPDVRVHW